MSSIVGPPVVAARRLPPVQPDRAALKVPRDPHDQPAPNGASSADHSGAGGRAELLLRANIAETTPLGSQPTGREQTRKPCEERSRLEREYRETGIAFDEARKRFKMQAGLASGCDY